MLRELAYRMPGTVLKAIRAVYRGVRTLFRLPFWAWHLIAYHLGARSRDLPIVGVHTVFLPGENALALEEWVMYHHLKGITHFFLYDNTGSTRQSAVDLDNPYLRYGQVNKYGVSYDETVLLSQDEIDEVIARIQSKVPGVQIIRWAPRDANGQIVFEARRLHFLHYKMPSLHADMSDRFVAVDTGIDPTLLETHKTRVGTEGGPEWRLKVVNPDWRALMEQIDPSWHLVRASNQLADERRAFAHGVVVAAVARTMLPAEGDRDGC